MLHPLPNLRMRRAAVLLALVATLAGQGAVAHGHGGASDRLASVAAASEALHEATECAACVAQAQRQCQSLSSAVSLAPAPPRRIALPASERGALGPHRRGLPPERGPPHSA